MLIVLDTSTIVAEDYGRSARIRALLSAAATVGYTVCVPSLAVVETAAKFSRELERNNHTIRRDVGQLSRLLGRSLELPAVEIDQDAATRLFEEDIRTRFAEAGVTFLPYPEVGHEELVKRAIARERPFDQKGSGYRDALIWFSIRGLASESECPIFLVSGDGDFGEGKTESLHQDLRFDLIRDGYPPERVCLYKSLSSIVDDHVRPILPEALLTYPQSTLFELAFDIQNSVASAAVIAYGDDEWDPTKLGLPPQCFDLGLEDIVWTEIRNVVDVRQLPDYKLLVRVEAELSAEFEACLLNTDLRVLPDHPEIFIENVDRSATLSLASVAVSLRAIIDLTVHEFDPNEHEAQVVSLEPNFVIGPRQPTGGPDG